ncbi:MAG: HEAT repeat domain-containing protein [Methanomicrobiales archaeon]|nr:HEAT repeat domain-containing protein [Methanomicrobiales archaeon]
MIPPGTISLKTLVTVAAVIGSLLLELVLHLFFGISVAYTHFFYVALVAAGIWYQRRALMLAVLLGVVHVGIEYTLRGFIPPEAVIRAIAFFLVTLIAALAAEQLMNERTGGLRLIQFRQSLAIREGRAVDTRGSSGRTSPMDFFHTAGTGANLLKALKDRNSDIRNRAAADLGELRDPSTVPILEEALRDEDSGVRWKAAEALGKIGEAAVSSLAKALGDADADVRWKAAVALGLSGSTTAIEPLVHALADSDPFVRTRAAHALSRFGDAAIQPVLTAMKSTDPVLRTGAVMALGEMGGESAVDALIMAFDDPDPSVRQAAVSAVVLQEEKAIVPLIATFSVEELREAAASALAHIGKPAVQPLVQALESLDPDVRDGAHRALRLMDDPDALHALIAFQDAQKCGEDV